MTPKEKKEFEYSNEILELIDNREDFARGDLQGVVEALVRRIARDRDLLTFEERLSISKDNDLQ